MKTATPTLLGVGDIVSPVGVLNVYDTGGGMVTLDETDRGRIISGPHDAYMPDDVVSGLVVEVEFLRDGEMVRRGEALDVPMDSLRLIHSGGA
jgi:hypothetical protein